MNKAINVCRNCIHFEATNLYNYSGHCHLNDCEHTSDFSCSQFGLHPRLEFGEDSTKITRPLIKACPCCGQKVISGISIKEGGGLDFHITCTRRNLDKQISASCLTSLDKLSSMLKEFINEWNNRVS